MWPYFTKRDENATKARRKSVKMVIPGQFQTLGANVTNVSIIFQKQVRHKERASMKNQIDRQIIDINKIFSIPMTNFRLTYYYFITVHVTTYDLYFIKCKPTVQSLNPTFIFTIYHKWQINKSSFVIVVYQKEICDMIQTHAFLMYNMILKGWAGVYGKNNYTYLQIFLGHINSIRISTVFFFFNCINQLLL